ncbi:MAG: VWA-like domain-containing protein [Sulfolobales archaeon]
MSNPRVSDKVVKKVNDAVLYLMFKEPLLGYFIRHTDIIVDEEEETASTDGIRIYISPHFFERLDTRDAAFVLAHEAMHIILKHIFRTRALKRQYGPQVSYIANVAADAIINTAIQHIATTALPLVYCESLPQHVYEICQKGAFEELVRELIEMEYSTNIEINSDFRESGDSDEDTGGHCSIGGGDKESKKESKQKQSGGNGENEKEDEKTANNAGSGNGEDEDEMNEKQSGKQNNDVNRKDIEREINDRLVRSYAFAKMAGRVGARIERVIAELLKPQVDWRSLLRKYLQGTNVKRTWSRVSRKLPDTHPGRSLYGKPRAVVLIDTSASISQNELIQFMTELKSILGHAAKVVVVFWDAEVEAVYELRHPSDIKKVVPKGGGGTMIGDALRLVDKQYRDYEHIVILSDWDIGDIYNTDVISLLKKYSDRIVAVTIRSQPPQFLRKIVRISVV